jgi:enolase
MKIVSIAAWQIFDPRGNPAVETEVVLENGARGRGRVCAGRLRFAGPA